MDFGIHIIRFNSSIGSDFCQITIELMRIVQFPSDGKREREMTLEFVMDLWNRKFLQKNLFKIK